MTRQEAIDVARKRMAYHDRSWSKASDERVVDHVHADLTIFVGDGEDAEIRYRLDCLLPHQ